MRVFFTSSTVGKAEYRRPIDEVIALLRKDGQILTGLGASNVAELPDEAMRHSFVAQGIAEADVVIIEASHEDLRIGHEITLALLYGKPTLVLSQHKDAAKHIPHQLLAGRKYQTVSQLRREVRNFLATASEHITRGSESVQAIESAADSLHLAALTDKRHNALRDKSQFGEWARLVEKDPEKAATKIYQELGHLPAGNAWSAFAAIHNEDTPDYIFTGVARFVRSIFSQHGIGHADLIADAVTGTGAIARNLAGFGYSEIAAFDSSREMLAEAFRLCAHVPSVKPFEADIANVELRTPAQAIMWLDYRSNFALNNEILFAWLRNLVNNLAPQGVLIFDVRTATGWAGNSFHRKVSTYATSNFQRVGVNIPDKQTKMMTFDRFIRTRENGEWSEWRRETFHERMWSLAEVRTVVETLDGCVTKGIYGDDFAPIKPGHEPGLAYFVLEKQS